MTIKDRICTALMGQMPDRVPFTIYRGVVTAEKGFDDLIAQGMGFMASCRVYNTRHPNVEISQEEQVLNGVSTKVVRYKTPVGEIWQRSRIEPGYGSSWNVEHFIKDVRDYEVLEFFVRDMEYSPNYDAYRKVEGSLGDTGIVMAWTERVPIQRLWIQYTGIERLSVDLNENLPAVERVMEAMIDKARELWDIVAGSPAEFVWCPDNITGEMTGPPLFDKYCIPYYREVVDVMHKSGKRVLCHMDGMMRWLAESVRETDLDVIEAFTPPPDGNLPLAEARKAWQDKVISINFPSSVHIADPGTIRDVTLQLLREATPGNGFVIGVTENVPKSVGTRSLSVIADTISKYGTCPIPNQSE
jgi:hypothetical protein